MIRYWLIFTLLFTTSAHAQDVLKYNLGTTGSSIPYENAVDSERPGIFVEILPLVMNRAGIKTEKVMLSTKRAMRAFKNGELDFDFFSPSWLSAGNNTQNFLFSHPILTITEYFIALPENVSDYKHNHQAYGKPVGTIEGYIYFDDDKFIRLDFNSEERLIRGLSKKRVLVGIMEEAAANYWSAKLDTPIALGAVHTSGDIALRLHIRHADKLAKINLAIDDLKRTGAIDAVLAKYADFSGVMD